MRRLGIRIANVILFALCCFLAANVFNEISGEVLRSAEASVPEPAPPPPERKARWADRRVILDRNVFGARKGQPVVVEEVVEEDLEETELPLVLLGTAAAEEAELSNAAVQNSRTKLHQIVYAGDVLAGYPAVSVVRIERRRVVLQNGPNREELRLDKEDRTPTRVAKRVPRQARRRRAKAGLSPGEKRALAAQRRRHRAAGKRLEQSQSVQESLQRLIENSESGAGGRSTADLFSGARAKPKYAEDDPQRMVGMELQDVKAGSLYQRVGLSSGDVITELNGITIDSPAAMAKVYSELTEAQEFKGTVIGPEGERSLDVDRDRVSSLFE